MCNNCFQWNLGGKNVFDNNNKAISVGVKVLDNNWGDPTHCTSLHDFESVTPT